MPYKPELDNEYDLSDRCINVEHLEPAHFKNSPPLWVLHYRKIWTEPTGYVFEHHMPVYVSASPKRLEHQMFNMIGYEYFIDPYEVVYGV